MLHFTCGRQGAARVIPLVFRFSLVNQKGLGLFYKVAGWLHFVNDGRFYALPRIFPNGLCIQYFVSVAGREQCLYFDLHYLLF